MSTEQEIAEKTTSSELGEHRWAVISERGCEGTRLAYEDAVALLRSVRGENVHGVCIITEAAASRLPTSKIPADATTSANGPDRTHKAARE